jgi:hypothetical protein
LRSNDANTVSGSAFIWLLLNAPIALGVQYAYAVGSGNDRAAPGINITIDARRPDQLPRGRVRLAFTDAKSMDIEEATASERSKLLCTARSVALRHAMEDGARAMAPLSTAVFHSDIVVSATAFCVARGHTAMNVASDAYFACSCAAVTPVIARGVIECNVAFESDAKDATWNAAIHADDTPDIASPVRALVHAEEKDAHVSAAKSRVCREVYSAHSAADGDCASTMHGAVAATASMHAIRRERMGECARGEDAIDSMGRGRIRKDAKAMNALQTRTDLDRSNTNVEIMFLHDAAWCVRR